MMSCLATGFLNHDAQGEAMNGKTAHVIHWSFWVIGTLALIWNALGVVNFFMQMNQGALAEFPETHRAIVEGRPVWATGGFAVAVFGGTLGCLLLLLKKPASLYLFIASLLGVIVTMIHTFGVVKSTSGFGAFEISMMVVSPVVVAVFLIWYTKYTMNKSWVI